MFTISNLTNFLASTDYLTPPQACWLAITETLYSDDVDCLDTYDFVDIFVNYNDHSVVGPIETWRESFCAAKPCTNAKLSAVVTNIISGCSSELSDYGISTSIDSIPTLITTVEHLYPTFRQVVCLNDTSQKSCVNETLTNLQSVTGTITVLNADDVISRIASGSLSIPSNVFCTDCVKQAYNLVEQNQPALASGLSQPAQSQCGAPFIDGASSSDIQDRAITPGSSDGNQNETVSLFSASVMSENGAVSLFSASAMSGLALIGISSIFIVLA